MSTYLAPQLRLYLPCRLDRAAEVSVTAMFSRDAPVAPCTLILCLPCRLRRTGSQRCQTSSLRGMQGALRAQGPRGSCGLSWLSWGLPSRLSW